MGLVKCKAKWKYWIKSGSFKDVAVSSNPGTETMSCKFSGLFTQREAEW